MTRRLSPLAASVAVALVAPHAGACDDSAARVAITSAIAAGAGAGASALSSGILAVSDNTRDYDFWIGTGVGAGITVGLALLYALVDGSSNCTMVESGLAWSIPVTTVAIGALLPVAIWGATDELSPTANTATPIQVQLRF